MTEKKKFLILDSLIAYLQSERDGDEIFIKYKNEKIFPSNSKFIKMTAEPVRLDAEIEIADGQKWVELELWDYDTFTPNDNLGTFRLLVDEVAENFTAELQRQKEADGRYVLNWSVVERVTGSAG